LSSGGDAYGASAYGAPAFGSKSGGSSPWGSSSPAAPAKIEAPINLDIGHDAVAEEANPFAGIFSGSYGADEIEIEDDLEIGGDFGFEAQADFGADFGDEFGGDYGDEFGGDYAGDAFNVGAINPELEIVGLADPSKYPEQPIIGLADPSKYPQVGDIDIGLGDYNQDIDIGHSAEFENAFSAAPVLEDIIVAPELDLGIEHGAEIGGDVELAGEIADIVEAPVAPEGETLDNEEFVPPSFGGLSLQEQLS